MLLNQLVPDRHLDFASTAFWHYIPVHVPITCMGNPDNTAEARALGNDSFDLNGSSFGDQDVGFAFDQMLRKQVSGSIVWDKYCSEAVKRSSL